MLLYKNTVNINWQINSASVNLTASVLGNISYDIEYINWYLCYNGEFYIVLTFNDFYIDTTDYDVYYSTRTKMNNQNSNTVIIPVVITKMLNFKNKIPVRIELFQDNIQYIHITFIKKLDTSTILKNLNECVLFDDIKSKLRLFNTPEMTLPRKLRNIMDIEVDDDVVLSLYSNNENKEVYMELLTIPDLIDNQIISEDRLLYRTLAKVTKNGSVIVINIPKEFMKSMDIDKFEEVYWNIYYNKNYFRVILDFK